jgi:hypothetical protein
MILTQWDDMTREFKTGGHTGMELWPMDKGLFVVFEIETDFYVVRHDAGKVYFWDFYYVGYEGTTCAKTECTLADEDGDFAVCKFEEDVLTLGLPTVLGNGFNITGSDFDLGV